MFLYKYSVLEWKVTVVRYFKQNVLNSPRTQIYISEGTRWAAIIFSPLWTALCRPNLIHSKGLTFTFKYSVNILVIYFKIHKETLKGSDHH